MSVETDKTETIQETQIDRPEQQIRWNNTIIQCNDQHLLKPTSEICFRKRVGYLIVNHASIEQSKIGRGILGAGYKILTTIENSSQKRPGSSKLTGAHADIFDTDGFEIFPIDTDNPAILLNDLRECSEFLRNNLSQKIVIGWNLSKHTLKESDTLILLDLIAKGYRPDYIRFNEKQGLFCAVAKRACATKTVLPYGSTCESDLIVLTSQVVIKLNTQS